MLACNELEQPGVDFIINYTQRLCFVNGLSDDKIQMIVKSRNFANFNEMAELALSEESAIESRMGKFRFANDEQCRICKKVGHDENKCFFRKQVLKIGDEKKSEVTCYKCKKKGHINPNCPLNNKNEKKD